MLGLDSQISRGVFKKVLTGAMQSRLASDNTSGLRKIKDDGVDEEDSENIDDIRE